MIIAAFAGTGKTYFCEYVPQAIDFVCMPWKYTNFYEVIELGEGEYLSDKITCKPGTYYSFYKWYNSQSHYRIKEDKEKDKAIMESRNCEGVLMYSMTRRISNISI